MDIGIRFERASDTSSSIGTVWRLNAWPWSALGLLPKVQTPYLHLDNKLVEYVPSRPIHKALFQLCEPRNINIVVYENGPKLYLVAGTLLTSIIDRWHGDSAPAHTEQRSQSTRRPQPTFWDGWNRTSKAKLALYRILTFAFYKVHGVIV